MKASSILILVLLVLVLGLGGRAQPTTVMLKPTPNKVSKAQIRPCSVTGTVTDNNGAVLPGVRISLLASSSQSVLTNGEGSFRIDVPWGAYRLRIVATGFTPAIRQGNCVPGQSSSMDVTLKRPALTPSPTPKNSPTPTPPQTPTQTPTPSITPTPTQPPINGVTPTPTTSPTPNAKWIERDELMKVLNPDGRWTYDAPTEMTQGDSADFIVRISAKDIGEELTKGLANPSAPEKITVSPKMKLVLTSPDQAFEIIEQSTQGQLLGDDYSQWKWRIKALKSGPRSLHLSVFAVLSGNEGKDIPIGEKSININVSYGYVIKTFFTNNWQYLLGSGVLTGLLGWLVRWLFNRSKKPPAGKDWEQA